MRWMMDGIPRTAERWFTAAVASVVSRGGPAVVGEKRLIKMFATFHVGRTSATLRVAFAARLGSRGFAEGF